jgi:cysteine-rich repeat protein
MRIALLLALMVASSCDCSVEPLAVERGIIAAPELLDFGAIAEGTSVARDLVIENTGAGPLEITAALGADTAGDFVLETSALLLDPRSTGALSVRFSPTSAGEDGGSVVLASNDTQNPEVTVLLHGGPIEPALTAPAEIDFSPADASIVARTVVFTNDGLAILRIESSAIDVAANPQFAAPDAPFDVDVLPGESKTFDVTHSRSTRTDDGRLLVRSNDPDDAAGGGVRAILLHPDPLGECEDGADNDGDLLEDFPDDPGCADRFDESEQNAVECVDGATQICGSDVGVCESGTQTCVSGQFGDCDGAQLGGVEACDGIDNDCDGRTDEDVSEACDANGATAGCEGARLCVEDGPGVFGNCLPATSTGEVCDDVDNDCDGAIDNGVVETCTVDGCPGSRLCIPESGGNFTACQPDDPACTDTGCGNGTVETGEQCDDNNNTSGDGCSATCTDESVCAPVAGTYDVTIGGPISYSCCLGIVSQDFSSFVFQQNGASVRGDAGSQSLLPGTQASCADGSFAYAVTIPGGCDETYELTGTFTSDNTFVGTYRMLFNGTQCECGGFEPCEDQEFTVTATR